MRKAILSVLLVMVGSIGFAADQIPLCMGGGQPLPENNSQVLSWKQTTKNQFKSRGHVQGILKKVYADKTGHDHFSVQIGNGVSDTVEIIYNEEFGAIPDGLQIGAQVEACGDYITANRQAGGYPPSPDGAIVHWVHKSPQGKHEDGFVAIDGVLYGQDAAGAGPKKPRN